MADIVYILGIGPGSRDYLLPVTKKKAGRMDVLIGGRRALSLFAHLGKTEVPITADLDAVRDYIIHNRTHKRIGVLVSGDPGLYSMLEYLSGFLTREQIQVEPGISSMQLAFARIGLSWQEAHILSLHGRGDLDRLPDSVRTGRRVGVFTGPQYTPQRIAAFLTETGLGSRPAAVFERLSYPDEKIHRAALEQVAGETYAGLAVMIINE